MSQLLLDGRDVSDLLNHLLVERQLVLLEPVALGALLGVLGSCPDPLEEGQVLDFLGVFRVPVDLAVPGHLIVVELGRVASCVEIDCEQV